MKRRQGFGPLELVVIIMIAVVIGLSAKNCKGRDTNEPTPAPSVCSTYKTITYCHQPAASPTQ